MVSLPSRVLSRNSWSEAGRYIKGHLNFYRIHVLYFTFTPLILAAVLFASNGKYPLTFVDALFNSISAMAVCGLATVDLSSLTPFQQAILFFEMCIGNPIIVSWVMVYVRRQFFKKTFTHMVETELARRVAAKMHVPIQVEVVPWWKRLYFLLTKGSGPNHTEGTSTSGSMTPPRLRPEMIRRMNDAPKLVNPSGWISEAQSPNQSATSTTSQKPTHNVLADSASGNTHRSDSSSRGGDEPNHGHHAHRHDIADETDAAMDELFQQDAERHLDGSHVESIYQGRRQGPKEDQRDTKSSPRLSSVTETDSDIISNDDTASEHPRHERFGRTLTLPRTQTIEFAHAPVPNRRRPISTERDRLPSIAGFNRTRSIERVPTYNSRSMARPTMSLPHSIASREPSVLRTKHRGFGGFPMPHEILSYLFRWLFPKLERKLTRTVTIPHTHTIASQREGAAPPGAKLVPYISFEAVVGRNSKFQQLTREELEELGGVEYRGLTVLLWIVAAYFFLLPLIVFAVIAPYMSIPRWRDNFRPPQLHREISPVWFSLFQVVSAFTNTGMSLQDQSLIPFQRAYPMVFLLAFLILAGNTAFPIFLRFTIWIMSRIVRKESRLYETLHFLLDHPRRCFIYLFPSHQTWFLVTILLAMLATDFSFFLILDIGNEQVEIIPAGVRVVIGFFQAIAVRAAGFTAISVAILAPAVKVLYVFMMYVSVYPIAMSVRSTNVYEEKSLGIFEDAEPALDEENFDPNGPRATVWGRYLRMHMRKQLSFDMWWLITALFLVCIVERHNIENPALADWFNIFNIIFELVSGYGIVGLSVGLPYANYSFSGGLKPLSKLIFCAVILRGRHRGLPVAIDRAVMAPFEFREDATSEEHPTMMPDEAFTHPASYRERSENGDEVFSEKSQPRDSEAGAQSPYRRRTSWATDFVESHRPQDFSERIPRRTVTIEEP